jgi:hypothetical protein
MRKLRASGGELRVLSWKFQCRCGSTAAKKYRKAWWCPVCGLEKKSRALDGTALDADA